MVSLMKLMSDGKTANVATCGVATLIGIKKGLQNKAMERALHMTFLHCLTQV